MVMLVVRSLGRRLASTDTKASLIIIKDSCLSRLKQIIDKPQEEFLRIHVEAGGCSGFSYIFEIDKKSIDPKEDLVFNRENYRVVVSKDILPFIQGASIEYTESLIKSSFQISNPLAETKCGCGSSFSIDVNKLLKRQSDSQPS